MLNKFDNICPIGEISLYHWDISFWGSKKVATEKIVEDWVIDFSSKSFTEKGSKIIGW